MTAQVKINALSEKLLEIARELDTEPWPEKVFDLNVNAVNENLTQERCKQLQEFVNELLLNSKKKREFTSELKANLSQNLSNANSRNVSSLNFDTGAQLKDALQKSSYQFETAYNEISARYYKPELGTLWLKTRSLVNNLTDTHLLETRRSNEIQLSLSSQVINSMLGEIQKELICIAEQDIETFRNNISYAQDEIKRELQLRSIEGFAITDPAIDFQSKYSEILTSMIRIETPFQGSCPKLDFRSIIVEMRSYSIMFILLVSTFGLNKSKNESLINGIYVTSLILIVIGAFSTYAKIQDTKIDRKEDELKKAREKMTGEIKRMVTDFIAEWKYFVLSRHKSAVAEIAANLDRALKNDLKVKHEQLTQEKTELSRNLVGIEALDRKYQDTQRKCESFKNQIDALRQEI